MNTHTTSSLPPDPSQLTQNEVSTTSSEEKINNSRRSIKSKNRSFSIITKIQKFISKIGKLREEIDALTAEWEKLSQNNIKQLPENFPVGIEKKISYIGRFLLRSSLNQLDMTREKKKTELFNTLLELQKRIRELNKNSAAISDEIKTFLTDTLKLDDDTVTFLLLNTQELLRKLNSHLADLKTQMAGQKTFKLIAKGKAKSVYAHAKHIGKVIYTPLQGNHIQKIVEKIFRLKETELKREVTIAQDISSKLTTDGKRISETNLALEMEEIHGEEKILGIYSVSTQEAIGDLDNNLKKHQIKFPDSLKTGMQIAAGLQDLHQAGYVHGDLKPENILLYDDGKKIAPKITDFGKTRAIKDNQRLFYAGDPRYSAPEGGLTKSGEVFGAGLIMIRILEEEFLSENGEMLISPREQDPLGIIGDSKGIEKFLILNKNCPQTSPHFGMGILKFRSREGLITILGHKFRDIKRGVNEIHGYIDALIEKLKHKYRDMSPDKFDHLQSLLKEMTGDDPTKRPTMEQVVEKLRQAPLQESFGGQIQEKEA